MSYRKTNLLSIEDRCYLAGLFDGEGTITLTRISKKRPFRDIVLTIPSTTRNLLDYCKEVTNIGSITSKKNYKSHHKPSWSWSARSNRQNINLLCQIIPYMKEPLKIKRVNKILSEWDSVTLRNGRYSEEQWKNKLLFEKEFFEL